MNEPGRCSRNVFGCRGGELKCHVELWFYHQVTTSCGWCCLYALSVVTGQSFSKVVQRRMSQVDVQGMFWGVGVGS